MQTTTIVFLFLAAVISFGLVWFQYFFKRKRNRINYFLGFLRFAMIFSLLLLLINPKFIKNDYFIEKAGLMLVIDNSSSIKSLEADTTAQNALEQITQSSSILERFNVSSYSFGDNLNELDSLAFIEPTTNIARALSTINEVSNENESAIVLLSDGNQTLGSDYEFQRLKKNIHVYPIVLGDTTAYEDIQIGQVNCNNYAFLENKYPIEINISYVGKRSIKTNARILIDNQEVYREQVAFDYNNNSLTLNTLLEAETIGVKRVKVKIDPLENEKNKKNNSKNTIVEVIDEKTNVTIISSIRHPDIGMLKKSIEANEQRAVTILKPNGLENKLDETDLFILYQPDRSFQGVYDFIKRKGGSIFTITGPKTDWRFLNQVQNSFSKEEFNQNEDVVPLKNEAFGLFDISSLTFNGYPPLKTSLGEILLTKSYETIAFQKIKGVTINEPMFLTINDEKTKEAVLFGEDIWKWRVQSYRNEMSFNSFDNFIGKLILYLSDSKQKSRLTLDYETIYDGIKNTTLKAQYFDETYTFDAGESLTLRLSKSSGKSSIERPMLLTDGFYQADLSDLEAGDYTFVVEVVDEKILRSGRFTILDFDLESQFLSANDDKLQRLAEKTNGELFYASETNTLIQQLLSNPQYTPTQKSTKNIVSLIDFRWLLAIIAITLTTEWFIRKYNGLL